MNIIRLRRSMNKLQMLSLMALTVVLLVIGKQFYDSHELEEEDLSIYRQSKSYAYEADGKPRSLVNFDHTVPLIWVGGVPRSGTTLSRAMLDAHPDIRCGEETRVIPRILGMHAQMMKSQLESTRLQEAKITEDVLNDAMGAYILSIIAKHGEPASRLCNKDPFTLRSTGKILKIFPNSKFILMIRDGRATVHSIISRKVTIKGFDNKSYRGALQDWNRAIENMFTQCQSVGPTKCLPVFYEQLVLHPEREMRKILNFLHVDWNDKVIHHEKTIGQAGGVSLSKKELSTDQVNKPVNTEALTKWVGHIPPDVRQDMDSIAPMLKKLGYDPTAYPPDYGTPDQTVKEHSDMLHQDQQMAKGLQQ